MTITKSYRRSYEIFSSSLPSVFNRLEIRLPFPRRTFRPFGGIFFSLLFRRKIQILAIGYISASILTVILFPIEFSFAAIARIGIAWAAAITALMTFLILFSLIIKTKEKLQ